MSQLTLKIGGRQYKVQCADGEEAHVAKMGEIVNARLTKLGLGLGQNEAKSLLFAALVLADKLHEANIGKPRANGKGDPAAVKSLKDQIAALKRERDELNERLEEYEREPEQTFTFGLRSETGLENEKLAANLEKLAGELEAVADRVEADAQ